MISGCAGLVTITEGSTIIRLVHHTTQDYLETSELLVPLYPNWRRIHLRHLSHLMLLATDSARLTKSLENDCVATHSAVMLHSIGLMMFVELFLRVNVWCRGCSINWCNHLRQPREILWSHLQPKRWYSNPTYGIHLLAKSGLYRTLRYLLHEGIDRNTREGRDIIPLAYAADIENPRIADLLLENWAHVDLADDVKVTLSS